ncbi:SAG-related sequence [Besnoitia besnoiti]|uniref:SAG-related sequence n=1 Tax=Besnoitia besnoiti TaxID=94643 RepID=A0A2A9MGZ7_BESBE|nr:SAG-related sequence [Besnoitia besnoiti]PFH37245.1 SAG-related sequence [Besnoitia besnoiti]
MLFSSPGKCDGGADVKEFEITSNDTTLTFACKQSDTLNPPLFDRVLQGDTCGREALLESVVPGASLVQHATSTADDTAAYTLTIKDLPKSPQTLCYQCKSAANQMSEDAACKILITVKEAKTDGEVTTPIIPGGATTSAPDASEAGHVLPRTVVCMAATVSVALVLSTLM